MSAATLEGTPQVRTVAARPRDAREISQLLRRCASETVPVSEKEVRGLWHRYVVVRAHGGCIIATAAAHDGTGGTVEVRSVAVDRRWRGLGFGRALVRRVMQDAFRRGRRVACVTIRPSFFERLGFRIRESRRPPLRTDRPRVIEGRPRVSMVWEPGLVRTGRRDPAPRTAVEVVS